MFWENDGLAKNPHPLNAILQVQIHSHVAVDLKEFAENLQTSTMFKCGRKISSHVYV